MNATAKQHEWASFLQFFNKQNTGKFTRLGVFEPNGDVPADYWLECGLALVGVDLDPGENDGPPAVQIMLGSMTHEIKDAVKMSFHLTASRDEDGLDVIDGRGRMTVLRFETNR